MSVVKDGKEYHVRSLFAVLLVIMANVLHQTLVLATMDMLVKVVNTVTVSF